MPECYTHVSIATDALMRSGNTVASHPAFMAGANGPDPLYMYQLGRRRARPDLPALALRMHRQDTGAFLQALVRLATTQPQQSYALGFITHYTTDCTLNPYIASMSAEGAPYAGMNGSWQMRADLDATLYHRKFRTLKVPPEAGTPMLITDDLAQVCTLLRDAIVEVYEERIPLLALADAFHDNLAAHRLLYAPTRLKTPILRMYASADASYRGGPLTARRQPAGRLRRLPGHWVNPYTDEAMNFTLDEVLSLAEQTGALCIDAAMRYWLGEVDDEDLAQVLGCNDYATGLPCALPKEPAQAPAPALQIQEEPAL